MVGGRAWSPGIVGEQAVFSKDVEIRDQAPTKDRPKNRRVRFAVESSTARPIKQDEQAPIKMVGGVNRARGDYQFVSVENTKPFSNLHTRRCLAPH